MNDKEIKKYAYGELKINKDCTKNQFEGLKLIVDAIINLKNEEFIKQLESFKDLICDLNCTEKEYCDNCGFILDWIEELKK